MISLKIIKRFFTMSSPRGSGSRYLVALDFDETVISQNSDIVARDLLPPGAVTEELEKLHRMDGWTKYMKTIFELLHKHEIPQEIVRQAVATIPPIKSMDTLLRRLQELGKFDTIIISDSNSYFISEWLKEYDLADTVEEVFTNPAWYEDNLLNIREYHIQDWCDKSTKNLCKGSILNDFIEKKSSTGTKYKSIAYVGDGTHDYCPAMRLSLDDFVFARHGFSLHKMYLKGVQPPIQAAVIPWKTGEELIPFFEMSLP